jgi:phosphatidylinositol alpha-1,6-mannosyltransferase
MEYVAGHLFEELHRTHDVRALTGFHAEAAAMENVYRCPYKGVPAYVCYALFRGLRECMRWKPDVILCGSVVPAPAAWMLSITFKIPYAVMMHGSDILHPGRLYQHVARWVLRRAARLSANSRQTRELLMAAGFDADKIDVNYPGVCVEHFQSPPATGADDLIEKIHGRPVLMTVGRLIRRKGVLDFVQHVMPEVVRAIPEVCYVIVGDDARFSLVHKERMRDRIQQTIENNGLHENVILAGAVPDDDLHRLYFCTDVFVLPCLDIPGDVEGFGIVFSEAALAGAASLATRVGGIPEAVLHEKTGVLVEPGDFQALSREAVLLLRDTDRRRKLAAAGAKRARREFSWPVIADGYLQTLEKARDSDVH